MGKAELYANAANLWIIASGVALAGLIVLMIPARWRIQVGIALSAAWLPMNQFVEVQALFVPAKVSFLAGPLLILLGLYTSAGWIFQRLLIYLFPLWSLWTAIYVLRTSDAAYAVSIRIGWGIGALSFAALAIYMVETKSFRRVLGAYVVGAMVPIAFATSAFVLSPDHGFGRGLGRFFPWGANPNQIGPLFASCALFAVILLMQEPRHGQKLLLGGCAIFSGSLLLATGSRSSLMLLVLPLLVVIAGCRRFGWLLVVAVLATSAVLVTTLQDSETIDFARFVSLSDSGRTQIAIDYFNRLINARPWLGLLQESGLNSQQEKSIGTHSHNVSIELLYIGGIPLLLGSMIFVLLAIRSAVRILIEGTKRRDPVLLLLGSVPLVAIAHSVTTIILLYPTNLWYLPVLLCTVAAVRLDQLHADFVTRTLPAMRWPTTTTGETRHA